MRKYYTRAINPPKNKSFFLFGPRGTGKTTWLKHNFKDALFINLLNTDKYNLLLAKPHRLQEMIPEGFTDWIIIDEVQKIPELLNEVHNLIESKRYKFILTGSSARKLRQSGVNLLAGRALTYHMYPLTTKESGNDFNLKESLLYGNLPTIRNEDDKIKYLNSYIATYITQEVLQERMARNLSVFGRFLEIASFSQGSLINMSEIARECQTSRKIVENYFSILEDLLIAYFIPVFTKRAKRKIVKHDKFYYFDAGIYNTIRPRGPLDIQSEIGGIAFETLVLQELIAINEYDNLGYKIHFWRTKNGVEVDFILYGENGLVAIEVKSKDSFTNKDLKGLKVFKKDYPEATLLLIYGGRGSETFYKDGITILPINTFFVEYERFLS